MTLSFEGLGIAGPALAALERNGIEQPFPVQAATIPDILDGRDVCGRAPTGSGKTLAFGLPILQIVPQAQPNRPTALILSPTRELAAQIRKDLAPYGKATGRQVFAIYGGVRYQAQKDWLRRGVDVLVATPGRLEDLIDQGSVDLSEVAIVAVDEADRMADMGFLPAVRRILDQTSKDRQTLLFSATLDGDVGVLIRSYQNDPVTHDAAPLEADLGDVEHFFWSVERNDKVRHAAEVVLASGSTMVFTRSRHGADRLAKQLGREGVEAVAMHGGRSQNQRNRALAAFSEGRVAALVATDVAARGIHVDDVATVLHYDPPNGHKDYLHRSGRTARAGATGTVVSLVLQGERRAVNRMARTLDMDPSIVKPDAGMLPTLEGIPMRASASPARPKAERTESRSHRRKPEPQADRRRPDPRRSSARRDGGFRGTGLHVSNLPWSTTDDDLRSMFSKIGKIHSARVKVDRRGRSKGIALVDMSERDADAAIRSLDGRKVKGRPIAVRRSTRQPS